MRTTSTTTAMKVAQLRHPYELTAIIIRTIARNHRTSTVDVRIAETTHKRTSLLPLVFFFWRAQHHAFGLGPAAQNAAVCGAH